MKKYIIVALCIINIVSGMEQQQIAKREPREWDAQAYEDGNTLQTESCFHYLTTNNINFENKTILSVGCGTGKIENILAKDAKRIHGFDASKNMTDFAKDKYKHVENLSFEHCFAEDFQSPNLYQLAIASHSIHWFQDKKQALQRINESLELHGELFGTVTTSDNPKPTNLLVFLEMLSSLDWVCQLLMNKKLEDLTGVTHASHQELKNMLEETNFEIIKCKEQTFSHRIDNTDQLRKLYWPLISSRPGMQYIPNMLKEKFFDNFITRIAEKLPKNEDGSFNETIYTTIVHARKIKK